MAKSHLEISVRGNCYRFDVAEASQTQTSQPFPSWKYESIIEGVLTLQALFGGVMKFRGKPVEEKLYTKVNAESVEMRITPNLSREPSLTSGSPVVRKQAADLAGEKRDLQSVALLMDALDKEAVWYVRSAIVSALQQIGGREAEEKVSQYRDSFLSGANPCAKCGSLWKFYDWGYSAGTAWRCLTCERPNNPLVIEVDFSKSSGASSGVTNVASPDGPTIQGSR